MNPHKVQALAEQETPNKADYIHLILWVVLIILARLLQVENVVTLIAWIPVYLLIGFVIWKRPVYGVLAVLSFAVLGEEESMIGITLNLYAKVVLVLKFLFDIIFQRARIAGFGQGTFLNWLPFGIMVTISWFAYSADDFPFLFKFMLTVILLGASVVYVSKPRDFIKIQLALVLVASFSGLWAVLQYLNARYRVGSLLDSPNYTAMYLASILPLTLSLWSYWNKKYDFLGIGSTVLIILGILLSGSRGGILLLVITILVFFFLTFRISRIIPRTLIVLTLIMILAISYLLTPSLTFRLSATYANLLQGIFIDPESHRILDRYVLWNDSIEIWKANPVLGVGPNNWYEARLVFQPRARTTNPHLYLGQIMAETGSFGMIAYLFFLMSSFNLIATKYRVLTKEMRLLSAGWIAAAITIASATFSGYAYNPYQHIVLILGGTSVFAMCTHQPNTKSSIPIRDLNNVSFGVRRYVKKENLLIENDPGK